MKNEGNDLHSMYSRERHACFKMGIGWDNTQRFSFSEHLKSKCVVEGESAKLSCFVSGIQPFFVAWYKDNAPLERNVYERYFIRVSEIILFVCQNDKCSSVFHNDHPTALKAVILYSVCLFFVSKFICSLF